MAENKEGQEKSEQPTGKRKSKARNEGNVAKSKEICFVAGLMGALLYFALNGPSMGKTLIELIRILYTDIIVMEVTIESIAVMAENIISIVASILVPFFIVLFIVAILANYFQIGLIFTLKPFIPKLSKFNVLKGLKRILFSPGKIVDIVKNVLKVLVIGYVPYVLIKAEIDYIPLLMDTSIWEIIAYITTMILKIFLYVGLVMLILAIIDLTYQKWKHKKDLMMTKQEVKDERKQAEGDPKVKAKIRRMQLQAILKRMMSDVPKADVVVTNPVHLAVALKYDNMDMSAPKVVAKGARLIAEKIKKIAKDNDIPIVENRPLAQSLYKMVEIGQAIPESLYKAVAEVLAYVYSRKRNKKAVNM